MKSKNICIIGGDSRQLYAAKHLADNGYKVSIFACELGKLPANINKIDMLADCFKSEYIILPLPATKNNRLINTPLSSQTVSIKDIIEFTTDKHCIFAGMCPEPVSKQLSAKAKYLCDYFTIEELTIKNALLTAEGILSIILEKMPVSVFGMKIAVCGYGRIGVFISSMLKSLGADVTVFARNHDQLTKAHLNGLKTADINSIGGNISGYECVINTIPAPVINENAIKQIKDDCLLIESASAPYGIDFNACEKNNINLIKAFSLPGKKNPKSAGIIIADIFRRIIDGDDIYE